MSQQKEQESLPTQSRNGTMRLNFQKAQNVEQDNSLPNLETSMISYYTNRTEFEDPNCYTDPRDRQRQHGLNMMLTQAMKSKLKFKLLQNGLSHQKPAKVSESRNIADIKKFSSRAKSTHGMQIGIEQEHDPMVLKQKLA